MYINISVVRTFNILQCGLIQTCLRVDIQTNIEYFYNYFKQAQYWDKLIVGITIRSMIILHTRSWLWDLLTDVS